MEDGKKRTTQQMMLAQFVHHLEENKDDPTVATNTKIVYKWSEEFVKHSRRKLEDHLHKVGRTENLQPRKVRPICVSVFK